MLDSRIHYALMLAEDYRREAARHTRDRAAVRILRLGRPRPEARGAGR